MDNTSKNNFIINMDSKIKKGEKSEIIVFWKVLPIEETFVP